ncbi:MAG: hypothetical protein ABTQ30_12530, partial [Rhizobiaceae bacterium]
CGVEHFLLGEGFAVNEGLHRGLAVAPTSLVWSLPVVQQGLRTPTGPFFESCFIDGIRGSGDGWRSMRRSRRRMASFSAAR